MILERGAIGFQRAIKLVKLGILAKGLGVDFGSLGIALTLDFLGVAISFGKNHRALAIGVGADFFRFGGAGGTQFVGHAGALGLHALVDGGIDLLDVIDAFQAHI